MFIHTDIYIPKFKIKYATRVNQTVSFEDYNLLIGKSISEEHFITYVSN